MQDFVIIVKPSDLLKIDLIWMVFLNANDEVVARKAIDFLIQTYTSLSEALKKDQGPILQELISKLIDQLRDPQVSPALV